MGTDIQTPSIGAHEEGDVGPSSNDVFTGSVVRRLKDESVNGQLVLPFFGPPTTASRLPRRYAGGLNDYRGTPIHVSRGVGMERGFDIPVRFLCPPEIGILDLRLPLRDARLTLGDSQG
ncbi:MAG: hypothetical protein ABI672_19425 [Vicinamibacteria bacterium]